MAKHNHLINKAIEDLIATGLKIKDQVYPFDYVGVNIKQTGRNMISLSQPVLIDNIIKDIGIGPGSKILHYFTESPDFGHFHYWSVIAKFNYLAELTRPDIQFAVHSCARFSTFAKHEHGEATKYIARH